MNFKEYTEVKEEKYHNLYMISESFHIKKLEVLSYLDQVNARPHSEFWLVSKCSCMQAANYSNQPQLFTIEIQGGCV
jgi:hypothetical protein